MGASIDGEEDQGGDDEPPHPRQGHRIATPEIRHHCKRTHQGQRQTRHMEHNLGGHHQPPQGPSRKRQTEARPGKLLLGSRRGQDPVHGPTFYLQEVSSRGTQRNRLPREVLQDLQTNRTRGEWMHRKKGVQPLWRRRPHLLPVPKVRQTKNLRSHSCRNPAQKTTRPKLDPTANAKVNALLKASREEAQNKPEPTKRSNPKEPAPQGQKSPGPDPEEKIQIPTVGQSKSCNPTGGSSLIRNHPPRRNPPRRERQPTHHHRRPKGSQNKRKQLGTKRERSPWLPPGPQPDPNPSPSKIKEEQALKEEGGQQQQGREDREGLETGKVPVAVR
ncbi:hypothetical protein NDU88_002417 [Pleurodeles waltl]|uniref:Uncharacterized protein n=1 Tax=Pleurodeles waltl TaxID=8319 RepID=A0AAV7UZR4_PLEWA|nr:hypothetical protein NDU88_002417 [Pleurodeles waltl]